jgi:hypothetical protein
MAGRSLVKPGAEKGTSRISVCTPQRPAQVTPRLEPFSASRYRVRGAVRAIQLQQVDGVQERLGLVSVRSKRGPVQKGPGGTFVPYMQKILRYIRSCGLSEFAFTRYHLQGFTFVALFPRKACCSLAARPY